MKYYRSDDGRIFAYEEDGSQDHLIPPSYVRLDALPPPTAAQRITAAQNRINAAYELAIAQLNATYPASERASWTVQELEAVAYLADSKKADTPWLKGAAKGRGISVDNLALRVKRKADTYWPAHGEITGKRQRLRDAIDALGVSPTQAQLDAIQW